MFVNFKFIFKIQFQMLILNFIIGIGICRYIKIYMEIYTSECAKMIRDSNWSLQINIHFPRNILWYIPAKMLWAIVKFPWHRLARKAKCILCFLVILRTHLDIYVGL